MRIKELHIYGYGKLENRIFKDLEQFYVFYGKNEAGKSTIMSFIHSILFGFPAKNQEEPRYEPKKHAKYGGMLVLETKDGEVRIERVKGKASGDVTVAFQDGRTGGEANLHTILQGIDRNYYQSIFSFNLQGLQNLKEMDENTLGKFLLSAGMIGNDRLIEAEKEIQKELDSRFKPSGHRPELNIQLKELKELEKKLKLAGEEQDKYRYFTEQQKKLLKELQENRAVCSSLDKKIREAGEFLRIKPLVVQSQIIEQQLENPGCSGFIPDGLTRLESLKAELLRLESQEQTVLRRQEQLRKAEKKEGGWIRQNRSSAAALLERAPLLEQLELERDGLKKETADCGRQVRRGLDEFGLTDEEEVVSLDLSAFVKEKVQALEWKKQSLRDEKDKLDETYRIEKEKLERSEARLDEWKKDRLPKEKRMEWERREKQQNAGASAMKQFYHEQRESLKQRIIQQKRKEAGSLKKWRLGLSMAAAICGAAAVYCLAAGPQTAAVLFAAVMILCGTAAVLYKGPLLSKELEIQLDQLNQKEASVSNKEESGEMEWLQLLNQDRAKEEEYKNEQFRCEEYIRGFEAVIQRFENWEESWKRAGEETAALYASWNLPQADSQMNAAALFEELRSLKNVIQEWKEKKSRLLFLEDETFRKQKQLLEASEAAGRPAASWQTAAVHLKQALEEDLERNAAIKHTAAQRLEAAEEEEKLQDEKKCLQRELEALLLKAGAADEETFRLKAAADEERNALEKDLRLLEIQLKQSELEKEQIAGFMEHRLGEEDLLELRRRRKESAGRQDDLLEVLSDVKHRIMELEQGGTYDTLLHQFAEKRSQFNEEAKHWARFALAKNLLEQTVRRFKTEQLPAVTALAEDYFSFLTEGAYRHIRIQSSGESVSVERADGLLFGAGEISRGTAEQLYISLRLALAASVFEEDPFPIMIDDGFVNFDTIRTNRMIELLEKLSEKMQIILFTCHETQLGFFENQQICSLTPIPAVR